MTSIKLEWWDAANERRAALIRKKWTITATVTDAECLELLMLQKLAEMVMEYDQDLVILRATKEADKSQEQRREAE